MYKKLIGAFLLALVFLASTAFAQDVQLLQNPSFETWTVGPGGPPDNWVYGTSHITAVMEPDTVHSGTFSAKVLYDSNGTLQFNQYVPVLPQQTYTCSLWVYDYYSAPGNARMRPWFWFSPAGSSGPSSWYTIDTAGWKVYVWSDTSRYNSVGLTLQLRFYGGAVGRTDSIWVDDVGLWGPAGNSPPIINPTVRIPSGIVYPTDNVVVKSTIVDNDGLIVDDTLFYQLNGGGFLPALEDSVTGNDYWFHIGPQAVGTLVEYYVLAVDNLSARTQSATYSYTVQSTTLECTGGSIFNVQNTFTPGTYPDCWPADSVGHYVTICGVVTAVAQGSQPRFFMQDQANTAWGGIYCYDYTLPSGDPVDLAVGDYIQINAHVHEYYGWTELDTLSELTVLGSAQPLPDTTVITVANLAAMCDFTTEPYEDILVRINNVAVTSDNGFGELWVRDASSPDSIRIDSDFWQYGTDQPSPLPAPGATYDWVIGVLKWQGRDEPTYELGWVIWPRFASDYHQTVFTEPEIVDVWSVNSTALVASFDRVMRPAEAQIPGNYSTTHGLAISAAVLSVDGRAVTLTTGIQPNNAIDTLVAINLCDNLGTCMTVPHYGLFHSGLTSIFAIQTPAADGDTSQFYGDVVTFKGVTVSDSTMAHPTNIWINDQSGPPYNGVLVYTGGGFTGPMPMFGDTVTMTARIEEYFTATEMTWLGDFDNVVIHGSGPEPEPYQVTVAQLNANREAFEGVLVTVCDSFEITNLSPDTSILQYGFMVRRLSPPVDSFFVHLQPTQHTRYTYLPVVGAHIRGITGVYKFQRGQYRISPRRDADFNSFDTWCGGAGPGCDYIPGDINGNGTPNGIDVVYGVTYLKGGATPKDTCDCRPDVPTYPFYGAMDVNGNCATNGIDITFFVAYLKGLQPALKWCLNCPPAALAAPVPESPSIRPVIRTRSASEARGND